MNDYTVRQGTTPQHIFNLPFNTDLVSTLQITYKQDSSIVLQKHKADCVLEGNTVSLSLTQKETFKFKQNRTVYIQVRVLTAGGDALTSDVIEVDVGECLDNEVLK